VLLPLLQIVWNVITPIFLLIGLGFLVHRRLGFDITSLVRLNFWVFVPSFLFIRIFESQLSSHDLWLIGKHFAILFAIMFTLAWWGARLIGADDRLQRALTASVLFYNSGNYGVPVARLAFPGGVGESVQAVAVMLQNISNFTIGLALMAGGRGQRRRDTLKEVFKLPMVYTLIAAWGWRASGAPLPEPLARALHLLADGLVPVALVTLGAQMATLRSHRLSAPLALSLGLRLCIAPLIGYGLVRLLGLHGPLAQAVVVSTSFPTAVNSALLAIEYDNEPDYAAAAVFYSTLVSSVTVSLVIYAVQQMEF
jgi:malate permease and related proteins